jgi:DNA-binding NarL/FixJ family response regulator
MRSMSVGRCTHREGKPLVGYITVGRENKAVRLLDVLTSREYRVLGLVAQGRRNAGIAAELGISLRTVENHLYRIFQKLAVSSRTEAALFAVRAGLLASLDTTADASGISRDAGEIVRYESAR